MNTTTAQITARETANAARKIVRKLPVKTSSGIQFTGLWIRKNYNDEVLMSYQTKGYKHHEDAMAIQLPLVIEELKANGFTIEHSGYGDYTVSR